MHRAHGNENNIKTERAQFIIPLQIGKYRIPLAVFTRVVPPVFKLR